ncbi:hypothetical protein ACFX13_013748 [Malus domestica]
MDAKSVYSSSSSGFRTPFPYSHTHISFAASTKASTQSQGLRPASSNQSSSPSVMVSSPTTTTSSMAKSAGGSPRITSSTSTGNKDGQVSSLLSQQAKNSPTVPSSWSPSSNGSLPLFRLQQQGPCLSLHGFSQREHDITFFNPLTFIVGPNGGGKIILSRSTRYISCVPPVLLLLKIPVSSHDVHTSKIQSLPTSEASQSTRLLCHGDPVQNQKLRTPSPSTAKSPSSIVDLSSALLQPCFFIFSFWITPAPWPRLRHLPSRSRPPAFSLSGTVACESAGEKIPAGGVESNPRWWARKLVVKTEELISIFDEVDNDGGGSEEGCGMPRGGEQAELQVVRSAHGADGGSKGRRRC